MPEGVALDDEAVYLVSVRQFEVDVSGGESMVSAPRVLVRAGHEASIQYRTGTMTGEGEFRGETTNLEFLTEREGDQAVRLSGSHSIVEESIRR